MTETELEKLIVRLNGDGSSYQRMIEQADAGNKRLEASLKRLEESQRKVDEQTSKTTKTWYEHISAVQHGQSVLRNLGSVIDSVKQRMMGYVDVVRMLKNETVDLVKTAAMGTGYFDGNNYFQRNMAANSAATWRAAIGTATAGIRRNLPTVASDESTYNPSTGQVEVYIRRITERQAEHEAYMRSGRAAALQRQEREAAEERNREFIEINRIPDYGRRMRALQEKMGRDQSRENKLRDEVYSTTGSGARANYERLDSNWFAKAHSVFQTTVAGVGSSLAGGNPFGLLQGTLNAAQNDPYQRQVDKAKELLDLKRQQLAVEEDMRRENEKQIKLLEEKRKEFRRDTVRTAHDARDEAGMSPAERRAKAYREAGLPERTIRYLEAVREDTDKRSKKSSLQEELRLSNKNFGEKTELGRYKNEEDRTIAEARMRGVDPKIIAEYQGNVGRRRSMAMSDMTADLSDEVYEMGMKGRTKRNRRIERKLRDAGYSNQDVASYFKQLESKDKAEDQEEMRVKVKELTNALSEQTFALKNAKDAMAPYTKGLKDATDEQRKQVKAAVKENEAAKLSARAEGIRDQFGDRNKALARRREDIDKMLAAGDIDKQTHSRALGAIRRDVFGDRSSGSQAMGGVEPAAYGSSEALQRLADFRELAFGGPDTGSGSSTVRGRMGAKEQQQSLRNKVAAARARRTAIAGRLRAKYPTMKSKIAKRMAMGPTDEMLAARRAASSKEVINRMSQIEQQLTGVHARFEEEGGHTNDDAYNNYFAEANPLHNEYDQLIDRNDALNDDLHTVGRLGDRSIASSVRNEGLSMGGANDVEKKSEEHLRNIAEKFKDNNTVVVKFADLK